MATSGLQLRTGYLGTSVRKQEYSNESKSPPSLAGQTRGQGGMKLGDRVAFELKNKPFWEEHRFRVSDANFGSSEDVDLRIQVEGASPLLGMVVIAAPVNMNEQ